MEAIKRRILLAGGFLLALALTILLAKGAADLAAKVLFPERELRTEAPISQSTEPDDPAIASIPEQTTVPEDTLPTQLPSLPETTAPVVYDFTSEEEELLLKLGMAERGDTQCVTCTALVMRTVLNRVEGEKFSSTIRGVIYAPDQFTPVSDGSFEKAEPNDLCREALEWVRYGWDESQGALYYEWCEGESWHSQNLNLLFQHCDTRFYN